ncbi:phage tail domain-containing protein [Priestia aryabhattai]|uniref:phage tail domain-containing protein n=1 Tax=Priestia aryabhattai TaxID=412384 RepID=UPI003CA09AEE
MNRVDFYTPSWEKLDLTSRNIVPIGFVLDSPSPQHMRENVQNVNGTNTLGTVLDGRTMKVTFLLKAIDIYDFYFIRNELFKLFNGLDFLYLVDVEREPGKRWKVKVNSQYDLTKLNTTAAKAEIEFFSDFSFAESIGTTQDPFSFDSDIWQFGQGLIDEDLSYTHTIKDFKIYNAGDIIIDPRFLPLTIEVTAAQTSSNITMSLTNNTTGETWSYTGPTTAGQVYQLSGVQTLLGGISVSQKTNYGLITLKPGYNSVSRNSGISKVSFINRFYYF